MNKSISIIFKLIPVFLSLLLLVAHFMRAGNLVFGALSMSLLFSLFFRHPYIARIIQVVLVLGAMEWIRTAVEMVSLRLDYGQPWIRLVSILGTVALFTLLSASVFFLKSLKERYKITMESSL